MHKSELEGMTLAELTALAGEIGAELSDDQTTLIYNILDAQSLQAHTKIAQRLFLAIRLLFLAQFQVVVSYISGHEKWDKEVGRKNGENVAKIHGRIQEKRREPVLKREDTSAAM